MCLTKVEKNYLEKPLDEERTGYKILEEEVGSKAFATPYKSEIINMREWNIVNSKKSFFIADLSGEYYKAGFHIYKNKKDALSIKRQLDNVFYNSKYYKMKLFKVKYINITAEGYENMHYNDVKVDVALKMKIIKEV